MNRPLKKNTEALVQSKEAELERHRLSQTVAAEVASSFPLEKTGSSLKGLLYSERDDMHSVGIVASAL